MNEGRSMHRSLCKLNDAYMQRVFTCTHTFGLIDEAKLSKNFSFGVNTLCELR